jgi:hypothetical protein
MCSRCGRRLPKPLWLCRCTWDRDYLFSGPILDQKLIFPGYDLEDHSRRPWDDPAVMIADLRAAMAQDPVVPTLTSLTLPARQGLQAAARPASA